MLQLQPRYSKILRDVWSEKPRTLLVVVSMTLGVAATGSLLAAYAIIPDNLDSGFHAINPSSAIIYGDAISQSLVAAAESTPGVKNAEGRLSVLVRVQSGPSPQREALLQALQDYDNSRVDIVGSQSGAWPPAKDDVLIERTPPLPGRPERTRRRHRRGSPRKACTRPGRGRFRPRAGTAC